MNKQELELLRLQDDRDFWKARYTKMKSQIEFFVVWTLITVMIITCELIINRYFPTN